MKESYWGVTILVIGLVAMAFVFLFQNVTNTDEQNYNLLKEITEAAMYDAVDMAEYKATGNIKIDREKFVENFVRRFSESASLANKYRIEFYDISEFPPKVSLKVTSTVVGNVTGKKKEEMIITNRIDAILETPY